MKGAVYYVPFMGKRIQRQPNAERHRYEFDLSKPIWLDSTIAEFKRHAKARFYQDNFVDSIDFDYLEIQVIEE